MPPFSADVIIIGAGPSGSVAAYELASKGISVLILEKEIFPRYKVCGGGLTHKIIREIPYDISEIIESTIYSIRFSRDFKDVFLRNSENPLMYCSMRSKLDDFLVKKAAGAGAQIIFGAKCMEVIQDQTGVTISTNLGSYSSRLLIGADGASGIVARSAGLKQDILPGLAWEAEMEADPGLLKQYAQTVFLDWGSFPGGYAWIFPKKDHFSAGVGGPAYLSKWMKEYFRRFIGSSGILPVGNADAAAGRSSSLLRSWPIPVRAKKGNFHNRLILIAGDSGGLTDPLTGEGIWYAVRSGKLAATAGFHYLGGHSSALREYSEVVNDELMTELIEAHRVKYIFNTVPVKIHLLVKENERVWRAFGKILRGERSYKDVRTGFGKYSFLWPLVCRISEWISAFEGKKISEEGIPVK